MGGGGNNSAPQQQATPPTLDLAQTTGLTQANIDLYRRNIGPVTEEMGTVNRGQDALNTFFGLRMLTDPGEALGRAMDREITPLLNEAQEELSQLQALQRRGEKTDKRTGEKFYLLGKGKDAIRLSAENLEARINQTQTAIDGYNTDLDRARTWDPVAELTNTFSDQYATRDRLIADMQGAIGSTAEYDRFQEALGRGMTAQQAEMERVQAQETEQSAIGARLMDAAMRKMDEGGRLSPEAQREAVQAARQGMAARGMATGSAALGAELLNRDRFSRQREFENLGFARGVEAADLQRRTQNTLNRQQAGLQNAQAFNNLSQFNTLQRDATNRFNLGLLGQSAAVADTERSRRQLLQQDIYNFSMGTDPRMMLAGLGSPYANMTAPSASALTTMASMTQPIYTGGNFTPQPTVAGGINPWGGAAAGALSGAAAGSALGPYGAAAGAVVGGVGGYLASS